MRLFLFGVLIVYSLFIFWKYIAVSLFKLFNFGQRISDHQAAKIIGEHFIEVQDKLLNTLDLKNQVSESGNALLSASIEQRERELSPVPFSGAIDFNDNKRYAKYTAIPVFILLIILVISPSVITESTSRIVQYDKHFEAPAPFKFEPTAIPQQAVQYSDVTIEIELVGSKIPKDCYVKLDGGVSLKMVSKGDNKFSYTLRSIEKTSAIVFEANGYASRPYFIEVSLKSTIQSLKIGANYPAYTQKEPEQFKNNSNLLVLEGTELSWQVETKNTSALSAKYSETPVDVIQKGENSFKLEQVVSELGSMMFYALGADALPTDSAVVRIQVIKDQFPLITSEEFSDTLSSKLLYFRGSVNDDYGFSALNFVYVDEKQNQKKVALSISKDASSFEFYHTWNLSELPDSALQPGSSFTYYFEVWDNDGVNGPKSAKTLAKTFKVPSKKEIKERTNKADQEIKKDLEASIEEAKKLQKNIDKLNKKLLEKKQLTWEEKKEIEQLLNQQKNLRNQFEQVRQQNEINNFKKSEFSENDERLMEKQRQLEELMEKVMDEETMKLLEELQKLMEKNNKRDLQEKLDELKLESEDIEKELDRSLELFKQLEFERKLEETIKEVKELKEDQEKLQKKTEQSDKKDDEAQQKLKEEQKQLEEKMKELEQSLEDLKKSNNGLQKPNEMPDLNKERQQTKQNMQKSSENLEKGNKQGATQNQQKAKEELEEMMQKMQAAQKKMQEKKQQEDLEALRRLRQNLMLLSFEQESLIEKIKQTNPRDPMYVTLTKDQMRLSDNSKMIQDSLFALSKRNMSIAATVNKEISAINDNISKSIRAMENRKSGEVMNRQQFVMTSINNLALILDESIQNAQKQQSSKKFGNKSCSKPGAGMPKMGNIKKLQKQLSDQLKQMQQQQQEQKGQKPGNKPGKKPGGESGNKPGQKGGRGSSAGESMAKMAAQQAAIREQLRKMSEEMNKAGQSGGGGNQLKRLQDLMEENEEDLVNMKLDQETINRQEEIMSRLLESERAEREREFDNKRESKTAQDISTPPANFLKYQEEKKKQVELLETIPPNLKPFYRNLVNDYFSKP